MELNKYKSALIGDNEDKAIEASNFLANRLDDEILTFLIDLLDSNDELIRDMAAITLAKNPDIRVVEPLFNAILKSENENARGVLVNCLAYFEIDDHFVDVFKLYLFGNFKVSPFAFDLLNSKSFDIRPRTSVSYTHLTLPTTPYV